jgi:hypothetical protein
MRMRQHHMALHHAAGGDPGEVTVNLRLDSVTRDVEIRTHESADMNREHEAPGQGSLSGSRWGRRRRRWSYLGLRRRGCWLGLRIVEVGVDVHRLGAGVPLHDLAKFFTDEPDRDHGRPVDELGGHVQLDRLSVDGGRRLTDSHPDVESRPTGCHGLSRRVPLNLRSQGLKNAPEGYENAVVDNDRPPTAKVDRTPVYENLDLLAQSGRSQRGAQREQCESLHISSLTAILGHIKLRKL